MKYIYTLFNIIFGIILLIIIAFTVKFIAFYGVQPEETLYQLHMTMRSIVYYPLLGLGGISIITSYIASRFSKNSYRTYITTQDEGKKRLCLCITIIITLIGLGWYWYLMGLIMNLMNIA